jgi:hypothetical protein
MVQCRVTHYCSGQRPVRMAGSWPTAVAACGAGPTACGTRGSAVSGAGGGGGFGCVAPLTRGDGGGIRTAAVAHAASDRKRRRDARTTTVGHAAWDHGWRRDARSVRWWRGAWTTTASDTGRRSEPAFYPHACDGQCRPKQPIGARHRATLWLTRWVPLVSPFPFSEILENSFSHKKNRYKVRKNLRKFRKVGNQIWNTFLIIDTSSKSS